MPIESHRKLNATPSPKVTRTKVTARFLANLGQRFGKQGRYVRIPESILKRAGIRTGSSVNVELQEDGSIVIRRMVNPPAMGADDKEFKDTVEHVLQKRKDVLRRLAQ